MSTPGASGADQATGGAGAPAPVPLQRAAASIVAGSVLAWLLLRMAWQAGGYFPTSYLAAGTIAFTVCAGLLLATRPRYAISTEALAAIVGLGGLAVWTGLSSLWSLDPSGAVEAMQRDLAYLALLALGLMAAGSGRYARHLVWLALAVTATICLAGLLARLFPDVLAEPQTAFANYRLAYPLTYWNGLGALAAMGAVLAFGLAADPRTAWWLRATAGALSVLLVVTMALSLSRGAWLALFAGLAVLVALGAHRGSFVLTAIVVGGGAALAVIRLQSYPALTDDPTAAGGQASAGGAFAVQLLLICGAVAVAMGALGKARSSPEVMGRLERAFRPLLIGLGAVLALGLIGGYAVRSADAEGSTATALYRAQDWIDRQWDDFMAPSAPQDAVTGSARVTAGAGGSRSDVYRVAFDSYGDHPLAGAGGGSFAVHWTAERPTAESVVNAHSLEIETLAELGIVGLALLLVFLGAVIVATVRSRRRPNGLARAQTAAVGGALAVWLVHSAVDWDWQLGAVTGVALLLACTVFPLGRSRRRRRRRRSSLRHSLPSRRRRMPRHTRATL